MKPTFTLSYAPAFIFAFVVCLPIQADAQQRPAIESLQFWGNEDIATSLLKTQMVTKASPWYDFLPFAKPRRFDAGLFFSDLQRLETFYQSKGYFHATIDTTFRVNNKGNLLADVRIDEGPRSRIGKLQVLGVSMGEKDDFQEIETLEQFEGKPYVQARLSESVTAVLRRLRKEGFAFARAEMSPVADSLLVQVVVAFDPGPVCEVSDIVISGNVDISAKTIMRGLTFGKGSGFDGDQMDDSRRQLYRSGVFRAVQIELPDTVARKTPIRVHVTERPFKRLTVGGGYDTEVGVRASAIWLDRNFGGGARQMRLSSVLSTESRLLVAGIRERIFWAVEIG